MSKKEKNVKELEALLYKGVSVFSGDESREFWRAIKKTQDLDNAVFVLLYIYGCVAQNLEEKYHTLIETDINKFIKTIKQLEKDKTAANYWATQQTVALKTEKEEVEHLKQVVAELKQAIEAKENTPEATKSLRKQLREERKAKEEALYDLSQARKDMKMLVEASAQIDDSRKLRKDLCERYGF